MRTLWIAVIAVALVGCFTPESEELTEEKYSTAEQKLSVCSSDCAPPIYNGSPVACASNIFCSSDAAGAYCLNNNGSWTTVSCTAAPVPCGDGICGAGENSSNCPVDCPPPSGPVCGDGVCESPERRLTCPEDCGDVCPTC